MIWKCMRVYKNFIWDGKMRESYVIYQSTKAAEDMFTAMELFPDSAETDWGKFISNEKAKVNLDVALILIAIEKGPYQ